MSVPSQELNGFLRLSSDWVFGPRTEAGDAERGREEDRVRLDSPSPIITQHPAFITSHLYESVPAVVTLALRL